MQFVGKQMVLEKIMIEVIQIPKANIVCFLLYVYINF